MSWILEEIPKSVSSPKSPQQKDQVRENLTVEAEVEEQTKGLKSPSLSSDIENLSSPKDFLALRIPELKDFPLSFSDSFLDFDSIKGWFVDGQPELLSDPKMENMGIHSFGFGPLEVGGDNICEKDVAENGLSRVALEVGGVAGQEKCEIGVVSRRVEKDRELVDSEIIREELLIRGEPCEYSVDFRCLIDKQLGKVSLDGMLNGENVNVSGGKDVGNGDVLFNSSESIKYDTSDVTEGNESGARRHEAVNDKDENESDDSELEDESSSSTSTSSDDEEDERDDDSGDMADEKKASDKKGGEVDFEEGEILLSDADEGFDWSDNEDGGIVATGIITSKNEIKILPPVPAITVTLQPHHQTLPVGIILSIIGANVVVEGVEKHNPLNEGSILWITESRSPLGIVDEIFGPVKNPYYVIRYNCEGEVPSNIQQGTSISFVSEFASHVLNDKSLYQKGYDASGDNDEELSDELEFSDDEKEAEYKKMLKMKKRGTHDSKPGIKGTDNRHFKNQPGNWKSNHVSSAKTATFKGTDNRHFKNQPGNWKSSHVSSAKTATFNDNVPVTEEQGAGPSIPTSLNNGTFPGLAGLGGVFAGHQAIIPPFPVRTPVPGFCHPNEIWGHGFPSQQSIGGLSGAPTASNCMQWMQQNQQPFQLHQIPPIQNNAIPGWPMNFSSLVDHTNNSSVGPALAFATWPALPNQNVFNPSPTGISSQSQQTPLFQNVAPQVFQCDGSQVSNSMRLSPVNSGSSQNFNRFHGGGGRRGRHRGGRHYGGGRVTSHGHQRSS